MSVRTEAQASLILTEETVYLLDRYRDNIALWMDLTDTDCHYLREVSRLATLSPLLLKCICAFTAAQLCFLTDICIWKDVAIRNYTESCSLLRNTLSNQELESDAVTAAILLSSYEVLAEQNEEHQRHFDGAMRLIIARGINAQAHGLDKANFWIYVRHELVVAVLNERPLKLPANTWNVPYIEQPAITEHNLTQELLWLVGRGVDLAYGPSTADNLQTLASDVAQWYTRLSPQFRGIRYGSEHGDRLTKVHFPVPVTGEWFFS